MHMPATTVILPVYNEIDAIDASLESLLGQDYEGPLTVVVADGGSDDGTRERLDAVAAQEPRLTVIDNPNRRQTFGLNLAAEAATGEILVRADGHTWYAPDYVATSVRTVLDTDGAAGGPMNAVGTSWFSRCVAAAMGNPFGVGPGRFHHATTRERVDTVYLGAFRRADFLSLGGFRALPSGTAEDADFYARWRASGRTVIVDPEIRSEYHPRRSPARLARQYFSYGAGKAEMLWINGSFPSARPLAPLVFVLVLLAAIVVGLTGSWVPLTVVSAAWLTVVVITSLPSGFLLPGVVVATAVMHVSYGVGTLWGLLRGKRAAQPSSSATG